MTKLQVGFDEPEHGWIGLQINDNHQSLHFDVASHAESFHELINALSGCLEEKGEFVVSWLLEPDSAELWFKIQGGEVSLQAYDFAASNLRSADNQPRLSAVGSYREVCLPFWRALRALEGRFTKQELDERIQDNFPVPELARLTTRIRSNIRL